MAKVSMRKALEYGTQVKDYIYKALAQKKIKTENMFIKLQKSFPIQGKRLSFRYKRIYSPVHACVCVCKHICAGTCAEVKTQLRGTGSHLPPCFKSGSLLFLTVPCIFQTDWPMIFWLSLLPCLPSHHRSAGIADASYHIQFLKYVTGI